MLYLFIKTSCYLLTLYEIGKGLYLLDVCSFSPVGQNIICYFSLRSVLSLMELLMSQNLAIRKEVSLNDRFIFHRIRSSSA